MGLRLSFVIVLFKNIWIELSPFWLLLWPDNIDGLRSYSTLVGDPDDMIEACGSGVMPILANPDGNLYKGTAFNLEGGRVYDSLVMLSFNRIKASLLNFYMDGDELLSLLILLLMDNGFVS